MDDRGNSFTPPREVTDPDAIAEICRFRARVWAETGHLAQAAFGPEGWRDPIDSHCQQWVIRAADGTLVAAGRLSVHARLEDVHQAEEYRRYGLELEGPVAAPDRVVVASSVQGCGLGRQILDIQDATARQRGARWAVRQASPGMVRLLCQRGWQIVGPASADPRFPGMDFQVAVKDLREAAGRQPAASSRSACSLPCSAARHGHAA